MTKIHVVKYWQCEVVTHLDAGVFEVIHNGESHGEFSTLSAAVADAKALSFPAQKTEKTIPENESSEE